MTLKHIALAALVALTALGAATSASAQVHIDKHKAVATQNPVVSIDNALGQITVIAWDKNDVWVKGTLSAGAEGIDFDSEPQEDWQDAENGKRGRKVMKTAVGIQVSVPDSWTFESDDDTDYRSVLEIMVPRGASIEVNSTNAPIAVSGTTGGIQIDTVNGPVKVSGGGGTIEIRSLTGDVDYSGAGRRVDAETVSGAVRLDLTAADAHVRTVKGAVTVRGRILSELGIETTAGNVTVEAGDGGNWRIETFSGSVSLALPATTSARFHLKSAEGSITSNVGPKARREERFNPFRILEFRVGDASSDIEIETYSGAITLKVAGVSALTSTPDGNGVASSGRADATLIH